MMKIITRLFYVSWLGFKNKLIAQLFVKQRIIKFDALQNILWLVF